MQRTEGRQGVRITRQPGSILLPPTGWLLPPSGGTSSPFSAPSDLLAGPLMHHAFATTIPVSALHPWTSSYDPPTSLQACRGRAGIATLLCPRI